MSLTDILVAVVGGLCSLNLFMLGLIFRRLDRFEDKFQTKEMCETLHQSELVRG